MNEIGNLKISASDEVIADNENQLIIGENYDALKELVKTHRGKIGLIYIDPPYNIKKDLIYKNNFISENWLEMMKKRLVLAKLLLNEQGVILVSINDYEQAYLKVLMDEIFGKRNFLGTIIWINGVSVPQRLNIQKNHEYIHVYCASPGQKLFKRIINIDTKKIYQDEKGSYIIPSSLIASSNGLNGRPNAGTSIYWRESDNSFVFKDDYDKNKARVSNDYDEIYEKPDIKLLAAGYQCIRPRMNGSEIQGWTRTKRAMTSDNIIIKKNKKGHLVPYRKTYLTKPIAYYNIFSIVGGKAGEHTSSSQGSRDLRAVLVEKVFDYPKPVEFMKKLIRHYINKDTIVLDFFAGSGTTGQAVLELNREDGGKRKFILCTNNENDIAYNVTYERLYRIMKGKGTKGETDFKWLKKNKPFSNEGLRVFLV